VWSMTPTKRTIFFKLQFIRSIFLILGGRIITTLACATCEDDYVSHSDLPKQKVTLPRIYQDRVISFCAVTT